MAKQKTIDLSLTVTEVQHVREAIRFADFTHKEGIGRSNPALTRALTKVDKAVALYDSGDLEPVKDATGDA